MEIIQLAALRLWITAVDNTPKSIIPKDSVKLPNEDGAVSIENLLKIVFTIMGGIALIIIVLAGIQFMTSEGDPGKVTKARNTLIYAAVGLAIAVAAFSIVSFVLGRL